MLIWHLDGHAEKRHPHEADSQLCTVERLVDAAFSSDSAYLLIVSVTAVLVFHSRHWDQGATLLAKAGFQPLSNPTCNCSSGSAREFKKDETAWLSHLEGSTGQGAEARRLPPLPETISKEGEEETELPETSGREIVGGLLLNGWQPSGVDKGNTGIALLMWNGAGSAQLIWVAVSGSVSQVASLQLPKHSGSAASVTQVDSHSVAVFSNGARGEGPWLKRLPLPLGASLDRPPCNTQSAEQQETVRGSEVEGLHHTDLSLPATSQGSEDQVTVSMVASRGSQAPHLLFKVKFSPLCTNILKDLAHSAFC